MKNLLRPEWNRMYEVMRRRIAGNLGRCIMLVLSVRLIESIVFIIPFSVLAKIIVGDPGMELWHCLSVFPAALVMNVLTFGIVACFTGIIVRGKIETGSLLAGVKNRNAVLLSVVHAVVQTFSFAAGLFAALHFIKTSGGIIESYEFPAEVNAMISGKQLVNLFAAVVLFSVYSVLWLLLSVPLVFSRNVLMDKPEISFLSAVGKGLLLLRGKFLHYIGFVIYSSRKNLCFMLSVVMICMLVTSTGSAGRIIINILIVFFVIQEYTVAAKAYSSIPVYYYSLLSVNGLVQVNPNGGEQKEVPAEAGDEDTAE